MLLYTQKDLNSQSQQYCLNTGLNNKYYTSKGVRPIHVESIV